MSFHPLFATTIQNFVKPHSAKNNFHFTTRDFQVDDWQASLVVVDGILLGDLTKTDTSFPIGYRIRPRGPSFRHLSSPDRLRKFKTTWRKLKAEFSFTREVIQKANPRFRWENQQMNNKMADENQWNSRKSHWWKFPISHISRNSISSGRKMASASISRNRSFSLFCIFVF